MITTPELTPTALPAPPLLPSFPTRRRKSFLADLPAVYLAELIGLRSVRSTGYLAIGIAVSILLIGIGGALAGRQTPVADADPTGGALGGVGSAVIIVAALGVLAVTGDYASGAIGATIAAMPRRGLVLLAKTGALITVVFPVGVGSALLSLTSARVLLSGTDLSISLFTPGVGRAAIGAGLYLSTVAVLAAGIGWLLRSTAGALVTWLALWTVPTFAVLLLPPALGDIVAPLTPGEAGGTIAAVGPAGELAAWADFGVLAGYTVVITGFALLVLRRRDV